MRALLCQRDCFLYLRQKQSSYHRLGIDKNVTGQRSVRTAAAWTSTTGMIGRIQLPQLLPAYRTRSAEPSRVFLSRDDCVRLLNRVVDFCLSANADEDGQAFDASTPHLLRQPGDEESSSEDILMAHVFDALYDELEEVFFSKRGYLIPKKEAALVEATGGSPTYGEITGEGVVQFLQRIPLQDDDVLVDLGSGLGRLTLQVACSTLVRRCDGIELSVSRHEQACWVANRLMDLGDDAAAQEEGAPAEEEGEADVTQPMQPGTGHRRAAVEPVTAMTAASMGQRQSPLTSAAVAEAPYVSSASLRGRPNAHKQQHGSPQGAPASGGLILSPVELRCEDLMTADLRDGTAFFLCSTAFSSAACRAIADRLVRHPPFRLLVTSRALPFPAPLTLLGQFPCSFSWTAAGTAYVYVRSLEAAPAGLLAAFLSSWTPGPGSQAAGP